jgi:hypothetical protein
MKKMSVFKQIVFYFIASVILPLLVTEGVLRIYNYVFPSHIFFHSKKMRHKRYRPPGHSMHYDFRLNKDGFVDVEFSKSKDSKTHRIIGIGDSFVYGLVPYKNNFLTLFEERINLTSSNKFEVYNMGVVGIGPMEYLTNMVEEAIQYNPDEIWVFIYIGNDIVQSKRKLYTYSYVASVYYYLKEIYKYQRGQVKSKVWIKERKYSDLISNQPEDLVHIRKTQGWFIDPLFNFSSKSVLESRIKDALHYINKMKLISDKMGMVFKVFILPDKIQFDLNLQKQLIDLQKLEKNEYDFYQPNRIMHEKLNVLGISYYDFFDDFKLSYQTQQLFRHNDIHWNIRGNELATELLLQLYSKDFSGN